MDLFGVLGEHALNVAANFFMQTLTNHFSESVAPGREVSYPQITAWSGQEHAEAESGGTGFEGLHNFLNNPHVKKGIELLAKHGKKAAVKHFKDYMKGQPEQKGVKRDKPVENLPATTEDISRRISTGGPNMSGAANTVDEIPVVPPPRKISKSHPEYFTINLPFYCNFQMTLSNGEDIEIQHISLNSPYDPIVDGDYTNSRQPMGRDTWASIYEFYRVISADVNLTFNYVHARFGDDKSVTPRNWEGDKPIHALVGYYLVDDTADQPANTISFVEMKHSKANPLHPARTHINTYASATTTLGTKAQRIHCDGGSTSMSYHYAPENWDHHVTNLGLQERWTGKNADPDYKHYLGVVLAYPFDNGTLDTNERLDIWVDCHITYTVQWREVNSTLKRTIDAS